MARVPAGMSSAYSPVLLASTQVLDAAVQTINALHQQSPFDFGICLGDAINNTQYNELRWYIDVLDGKVITPSSGAHVGADTIDYQKPFQAAGLDSSIPWYQVIGNHDQSWMGSACEDEKTLAAPISDTVLNMGDSSDAVIGRSGSNRVLHGRRRRLGSLGYGHRVRDRRRISPPRRRSLPTRIVVPLRR